MSIDGATYQVWFEPGSTNYIAYLKTKPTISLSPDIKTFIHDAVGRGYIQPAWYLIGVEAGFEIWNGGVGLAPIHFPSLSAVVAERWVTGNV